MPSFGEELRRERELREISLREVSEATKINLRYLEAMEDNEFGNLPGGVFNRGFVRAYSQFIGVDADAMVNSYLLEVQAQSGGGTAAEGEWLRGTHSGNGPAAGSSPVPAPRRTRVAWTVAVLVVALLATLAVVYARYVRQDTAAPAPAGATRGADPSPATAIRVGAMSGGSRSSREP